MEFLRGLIIGAGAVIVLVGVLVVVIGSKER